MSSFQKPRKPGWENHTAEYNPDFALLALPTDIYADTHYGIATPRHLENRCMAHLRRRPNGSLRGLLETHSEAELFTLLCTPEAGLLVLDDRRRWNIAGLLFYFAGVSPCVRPEVAAAMRTHAASAGLDDTQIGYVEICCIRRGPWVVAYPDLHARMILDLRNRGVRAMYGIVHVENAALRRHRSLGYEIVSDAAPILLPVSGQSGDQPARYHLLCVDVDAPRQDELIQQMRERNLAFMDLDL